MDLRKLKTLIDLVSDSSITELEITEADGKVRIVKGGTPGFQPMTYAVAPPVAPPTGCGGHRERRTGRRDAARPHGEVADGGHLLSLVEPGRQGVRRRRLGGEGKASRSASSRR